MIGGLRQPHAATAAGGAVVVATCFAFVVALLDTAGAETAMGGHQPKSEGQRIYEEANCVGCHKWHGNGGGGYGGAALSLRKTELDRGQIIEVVHCGRSGTGMPHFDRDAYKEYDCYSGVTSRPIRAPACTGARRRSCWV
jgi:mono/diheme cytochrome c family protein